MSAAELAAVPGLKRKRLYAGVIDGRNVWKAAKGGKLDFLLEIKENIPDVVVSTSCSLMHVPVDVLIEPDLPGHVNGVADAHGLRIGADGGRGVRGGDDGLGHE